MALNIVSNFAANVAHRNLLRTDMQVTSSLSKLSAGTRVVSAKDDAASLAVGSRLRAEVRSKRRGTRVLHPADQDVQARRRASRPVVG